MKNLLWLLAMNLGSFHGADLIQSDSEQIIKGQPFLSQQELSEEERMRILREQREVERQKKIEERMNMYREDNSKRVWDKRSDPIEQPRLKPFQGGAKPFPKKIETENFLQKNQMPTRSLMVSSKPPNSELSDEMPEDLKDLGFDSALSEAKSKIESIFIGNFPDEISQDLQQFGYNLFTKAVNNFSPLENVPVNPEYVVGPGDTFTINVWGSANFSHTLTVRRDGTIFIPKIGSLRVWGDKFGEMQKKIEKKLSSFFSGIKTNIAFDNIRTIDVFVVGDVNKPGSYSVPSTSAVINVLFQAGGPSKTGSLRNIQIVRANQTIATVDLYDFLISGKNNFQKLQSQDVILVPVIGPVAGVAGHVKRPAIYEISKDQTISDLIEMAGGLSFTGEAGRLELQRIKSNQERITKDFKIADSSELKAKVQDGDLLKIFPVQPTIRKTVFLSGYVKRAGAYEFKPGMSVKDLIPSFNQLKENPYTDFIQIIRIVPPADEKQALFVNLTKILNGDESANLPLQERDEVVVYSKDELNLREKVEISGKVNRPGVYYFFEGMTLKDLIFMAGNVTQDAYLGNVEIARYSLQNDQLKLDRIQRNLAETLKNSSNSNPVLRPKDRVFVQGLSNWEMQNNVEVSGEVNFPGKYPFLPGERLSSVIERAGGFTKKAFLTGAVFTRVSVREIQARSLKQQISQLEESILQEQVRPTEGMKSDDVRGLQEAAIAKRTMLRNLQEAEVTGRMVIKLADLKKFRGDRYDIQLEPNDRLQIPVTPSVVTVMGEVYNPTSIVFTEGKDVQHYLDMAGGPTVNGDTDSIFVVKADGSVVSRQQNRGFLLRNFYQMEIERGDTILVPKDISRFSWLATTKDITDILFKIASTTGITIQAFK